METALEMDRNTVREKKQDLVQEENHVEGSEACDSDIEEVAMERLQKTSKVRHYKSKNSYHQIQRLRDKHCACEGQIEKLWSRDIALQQTIKNLCKMLKKIRCKATQQVVDIEKDLQRIFRTNSRVLKKPNEGRRASDKGCVQQGNLNTSCCEWRGSSRYFNGLRRFVAQEDTAATGECAQIGVVQRATLAGTFSAPR